jgi:hypothetical protein
MAVRDGSSLKHVRVSIAFEINITNLRDGCTEHSRTCRHLPPALVSFHVLSRMSKVCCFHMFLAGSFWVRGRLNRVGQLTLHYLGALKWDTLGETRYVINWRFLPSSRLFTVGGSPAALAVSRSSALRPTVNYVILDCCLVR